jgi:hypothetical protein
VKTTKVQIVNSKKTLKHKQQQQPMPSPEGKERKQTNRTLGTAFSTHAHTHNKNRIYFKLETNRSDGRSQQPAEEQENG